jgi:hypothetical protein
MSRLPSRRRFLGAIAGATLAASAGCLDSNSEATKSDSDARTLTLDLTRRGDSLREQFVTDFAATRPEWDEDAFEATLDGEEYTTQYRKPFPGNADDPAYAEHNGTYYRLSSVVIDEVETTRPVLRLFADSEDEGSAADGTDSPGTDEANGTRTVPTEELPEIDARAVHIAHLAARARGHDGGAPWGLVQRGGYVYRNEERMTESELLGDEAPSHVRYRDRRYGVDIAREVFYEPRYRATVEPVAESPERMEAILRAHHVQARFRADDLSSEAREIVRRARGDGYEETHPYSAAYEELLRLMDRRAYLDGNIERDAGVERTGRRLIRYDGIYYHYSLRFHGD